MKGIAVLLGSLALVLSILFPPLVIATCPVGLLALYLFVRTTRKEREALAERRHRQLMNAARNSRTHG